MRTGITELTSPRPLIATLPSLYWSDPLAANLCDAFDEALAPIFATLDCFAAYLDPRTCPVDMLNWLAGWIGLDASAHEPEHKRGLIMAGAATLASTGTAHSIRAAVVAAYQRPTEVVESGSATWSLTPDSQPGGRPAPGLVVRVEVADTAEVDVRNLDALVDRIKPAHVPHRVELVIAAQPAADPSPQPSEGGQL